MDDVKETDQATGNTVPTTPAADKDNQDEFQAAAFQEVQPTSPDDTNDGQPNIDVIMDVPVTLSLEVGRTSMSVGKLLSLRQGSVVELDRLAGEPLDVLVNGQLVARGEIVVVNDKFGIRLIDVLSPMDRLSA
jgi:flagellar motor switch protein FliN/FliY